MSYNNIGNGLNQMFIIGIIAIVLLIAVTGYTLIDLAWLDDTYKVNHPITPDVIIETKNINGVIKSDTTYIYKFD